VPEKSLETRRFQAFAHLEEPVVAPSWLPESLEIEGCEEEKKTGSKGGVRM
jgi:hypothetical protein